MKRSISLLILTFTLSIVYAQKPRARDLGVPFNGTTGQWNSINIPLNAGIATQKNNLGAIILVGGPNFILDNIYVKVKYIFTLNCIILCRYNFVLR